MTSVPEALDVSLRFDELCSDSRPKDMGLDFVEAFRLRFCRCAWHFAEDPERGCQALEVANAQSAELRGYEVDGLTP